MVAMEMVARHVSERGELVLGRRASGDLELRVNGIFVMDTAETTSERMLADSALSAVLDSGTGASPPSEGLTILVGGLGLGFTLAEVLRHPEAAAVVVVEIEPDLVEWHRRGVIPAPDRMAVLDDPRVEVRIGDVQDVVQREGGRAYDLVLLDVDNGPGFLVYDANADIYSREFLRRCADLVAERRGVVAVWSASRSEALTTAMAETFAANDERPVPVLLGTRETTYHLFLGFSAPAGKAV
jgi:spermidine synthase